ncbi:hypothetical protein V8E51_014049 [Hyaloscypha variabilis]
MDVSTFFDTEFGLELSAEPVEDRDALKKGRQSLGLSRDYVPGWDSRDAFREYFQNWMDGMIDTQNVSREDINIMIRENKNDWVATAHRPVSEEMLGFIRFDKAKGVLELTNFNAQLSRKALDIGVTSKRSSAGQAGTHGEGFKVASLVMARKGYQVRYESARFYWSFQFGGRDKRHLYCHLTPVSDTQITKRLEEESNRKMNGHPRDLKGNICEDVTVKVGKVYSSKGSEIGFSMFKDWIKVSFALNRPKQVFKTANGDLVMDQDFSGKMYLKGLFLKRKSGTRTLKFGYNFYEGEVNRDRQQMSDSRKEAATFAKIWAEAIEKGEEGVVNEYTRMLREEETKKWADVNLSSEYMTNNTALAVWKHMIEGKTSSTTFFYSKKTEAQDVGVISRCLKKQPVALPYSLWEPLYKFGLVRTPEEQRHHKLHNAPISDIEQTSYAKAIERSLRAILALDERTQDLVIVFKGGADADLDLLLQESTLFINDKWLDFEESHLKVPCWLSRHGVTRHDMPCDHIITRLYDLILAELKKGPASQTDNPVQSKDILRLTVSDSLRQMPRMIEISQGQSPGELVTTWTILEKELVFKMYGFDFRCQVTLHRESTCSKKKADALFYNKLSGGKDEADLMDWLPADQTYVAECGCQFQFVSQGASGAAFKGLDPEEKYFPMVARDYDQAFFGVPPEAIQPAAPMAPATPAPESAPTPNKSPITRLLLTSAASQFNGTLSSGFSLGCGNDEENEEARNMGGVPHSDSGQGDAPSMTLNDEQQRFRSVSLKLQQKEHELATALDSLDSIGLELRQNKADTEAQKQDLESRIEDLEGEIQRLQETQNETNTRCAELSGTNNTLQAKLKQFQAEKIELASRVHRLADVEMSRGLSVTVQGVLDLPSREAITVTLQGVLGMIQGVLNLGARPPVQSSGIKREQVKHEEVKREGVKRERVKDENDHDLYSSHPKRRKQAEPIDLTE